MRTVYKIVWTQGDALWSLCFARSEPPCVRYVPGQWVRAPEIMRERGCHLCVFADLIDVRSFVCDTCVRPPHDWQLWRCDAVGVHQPRMAPLVTRYVTLWVTGHLACDPALEWIPRGSWPPGTLFARAVRLVERIPWDHELLR